LSGYPIPYVTTRTPLGERTVDVYSPKSFTVYDMA